MTNQKNSTAVDRRPWVILVINLVLPRPNQVRYQRVIALAEQFNLIVVTEHPLPGDLVPLVSEVHQVRGGVTKWRYTVDLAKRLTKEGRAFYIHTQYSPDPLITGYLCKVICGCKWVYDLWDHPSLGWSAASGMSRYGRQALWMLLLRWFIRRADAWVIAMHPGILAHLPPAPVSCRLILVRPGYAKDGENVPSILRDSSDETVRLVFAGPITATRGLNLINEWARNYVGPPLQVDMIGACDYRSELLLRKLQNDLGTRSQLQLNVWGELSHKDTLDILRNADIGLCPVDPAILNYRYAYPVKIVEYMSFGLVVVATEGHGVSALVCDGETGFIGAYSHPGFSAAIDRAIKACNDVAVRQRIIQSAQDVVHACSWREINRELVRKLVHAVA